MLETDYRIEKKSNVHKIIVPQIMSLFFFGKAELKSNLVNDKGYRDVSAGSSIGLELLVNSK